MCNIIAFDRNDGYANAPQCYGIRASPVLFPVLLDFNPVFCICARAVPNPGAHLSTCFAALGAFLYSRRPLSSFVMSVRLP